MKHDFPPSFFEGSGTSPTRSAWSTSATAVPRFSAPTATRPPHFALPTPTREALDVTRLEACLKEALAAFAYRWPCSVTRELNALTDFIFFERRWWQVEARLIHWRDLPRYRTLLAYARARWVAYWSAQGVETLLGEHPTIELNPNPCDPEFDFTLTTPFGQVKFDEKTSCWPRDWSGSYEQSRRDPVPLIRWFYRRQSAARWGTQNRFFVVLHAANGRHDLLRAELTRIGEALQQWLEQPEVLDVCLDSGKQVKAAIVFVEA